MHVLGPAKCNRLQIFRHLRHIKAALKQRLGQIGIVVIEIESMLVAQEKGQKGDQEQERLRRALPAEKSMLFSPGHRAAG